MNPNDKNIKEIPVHELESNKSKAVTDELIRRFDIERNAIQRSGNDRDYDSCYSIARELLERGYNPAINWLIEIAKENIGSYASNILAVGNLGNVGSDLLKRLTNLEGKLYNDDEVGGYSVRPLQGAASNANREFEVRAERQREEKNRQFLEDEKNIAMQRSARAAEVASIIREDEATRMAPVAARNCVVCQKPLNKFLAWLKKGTYKSHYRCKTVGLEKIFDKPWLYKYNEDGYWKWIIFEKNGHVKLHEDKSIIGHWQRCSNKCITITFPKIDRMTGSYNFVFYEKDMVIASDEPYRFLRLDW